MFAFMKRSSTILILIMLVGTLLPTSLTSAATVTQTTADARVVEGTTDQPNQHVTIVAGEKLVKTTSNADKKYSYIFPHAPFGQIAVYQRDQFGFDQLIDVTTRPEPQMPSTPVAPQEVTFIGMMENEFVFVTHPEHTIHATYEGRAKEAVGVLRIPKNKAETVSVYVSSPEKASTPIQTFTAKAATPDVIQLDAPPHETLRVSGKTLPYVTVYVQVGHFVRTGQADASGKFDFPFTGWEQKAYEGQTYTVQTMHFAYKTEEGVQTFNMPAFQPSVEEPVLIIEESLTQLSGVTYPNADILLDGKRYTSSEASGYFGFNYPMTDQVERVITVQKDGQTIFTKPVKVKRNVATVTFEQTAFDLEDAQLIGKATPNQTFELSYWDRTMNYYSSNHQIRLRATSDANGNIKFDLPKQYGLEYTVSYIDEDGYAVFKDRVSAEDNRLAPTPLLKLASDRVNIELPPFYYPNRSLGFEAKIEKADGRSVVEKADLNHPFIPLELNDTFMIRTVLEDGRVSEWVQGKFDAIQKPVIADLTNHTKVLKGVTESKATLHFTKGITKEVTADATGAFEFPVNLEKVSTFHVLVRVAGKADQSFTYVVKDTMRPTLRVYEILSDTATQLDVEANEEVTDFTVAYYKGTTLLREGIVKPIRSFPESHSGFTTFAQLPVSQLKTDGVTHLVVKVKDRAGNWSEGNKITVKDITRPKVTLQKYVLPGERLIYGKTEPGAKVTFTYRSDKEKTVTVSKTGDFVIKTTDPIYMYKDGKHYSQVKITSMDASGNRGYAYVAPVGEKIQDIRLDGSQKIWFYSPLDHMIQNQYEFTVNGKSFKQEQMGSVVTWPNDVSLPATVTVKLINPDKTVKYQVTKTITKAYVGKNVSNVKFQKGSRAVTGVGEAHATLEVWSGSAQIGRTSIDGTGKFNFNLIRAYNEGENLRFVTIHKLGKSSSLTVKAKDNTAPAKPTVNEISAVTTKITGKAEKGATVLITYNGRTYTTKANNSGVYAYAIKKWVPGKSVSIRAKDASGNVSSVAAQTIKYVFKQFSVNTLRTTHTYVTGKGHPGATVQVYNGASKVGKAVKVDTKGNFKAYVNKQRQSNMLTVEMTRSGYVTKRINVIVAK